MNMQTFFPLIGNLMNELRLEVVRLGKGVNLEKVGRGGLNVIKTFMKRSTN